MQPWLLMRATAILVLGLLPAGADAAAPASHAPADSLDVWSGMVIGASVALLMFASLGNLLLAYATGQRSYGYYALWAAMVPGWGLFETRLAGLLMPGIDPDWASDAAAMFVVLAVAAAALGLRTALGPALPLWLARGMDAATVALLAGGLINMLPGRQLTPPEGGILQLLTLTGVGLAAIACHLAWRLDAARDFAISFTIPTLAMVSTFHLPPLLPLLAPASGDFVVLGACALQALCLMLIATRRLLVTASERDHAVSAGRHLAMLAEHDPLTSLLNRRGFVARAERLLGTRGASLILLDLDHFKAVNDNHGHDIGDELLCAIARALHLSIDDGLIGRMGGEEFAVVLPAHADAVGMAERLREAVAGVRLPDLHPDLAVTASAGIARVDAGHGFPMAYRLADQALIAAKRDGRNRACLAGDEAVAPVAAMG